jgi:lipopolysaccharide export system protein LptA
LEQGVSLVAQEEGQPPITLLAPVATYHRKEGFMTFPQGLSLLRGQLTLQASSGKVEFDEAGRGIQRIALQGTVALTGFTESGEEVVGSFGDALAEKREADRFWFTAEAAPTTGWVSLRVARPGQVQELKSWRLVGEGSAKGLQWFEGQGLACAASWTGVEEPSSLQATTLRVTFKEGQPAQALAQGQVALQQGSARAWGEVLTAQLPTGPGELANPKGPVRFATEGLQGTCGRLVVNADGSFAAFGGVQGSWQSGGEAGKGSRFAARQASGHLRQGSVTLMQEARVWEENRVLQAEQIHVERSRELVTASGQVLSQASAPGEGTTTIQAQELSYQRLKGEAVYWGGVKVQDQRGNLASESLTVQLSTKGELLWGDFQGQVLIEDTAGRKLRGEAASYDFASEKLVVTGVPVVLEEASGNRVEAKRVEWYRKTGNLEVKGDVESPSQTVYHPQKPATPPARRTPSPRE